MSLFSLIFGILSSIISIYSMLCLANIILTWIPAARYTKVGQFLCAITDPYLNFFRKLGWFQIGSVNFSPILSIGLLSLVGSTLAQISRSGRLDISGFLQGIVALLWQIIFGIGIIVFLLALIRLIVLVIKNGVTPYNSPWNHVDAILSPFCYKFSRPFAIISKKTFSYRTALAITVIAMAFALAATYVFLGFLSYLCKQIPF